MPRTTQEVSQIEFDTLLKFCVDNHLRVDGEAGFQNGGELTDFIVNRMNAEITVATLTAALPYIRAKLTFKTENEREFDTVYAQLTAPEREAFADWKRPRGLIDSAFNNAIVLGWLKARKITVTPDSLLRCVTQNSIAPRLQWQETVHQGPYGRHSGKKFAQNEPSSNEEFTGGRRNHAFKAESESPKPQASADDQRWRNMADALRGNTHSRTAEIQRIHGNSPRETYELRFAALKRFGE